MNLEKEEVELFYKLYHALIAHVNRTLNIVPGMGSARDVARFPLREIDRIRSRLYEQPGLIDSFVEASRSKFPPDELEIVSSWKHFVRGRFFVLRYLKAHAIFLEAGRVPKAYGVLGLISPFEEVIGPPLPALVDAVLLPFRDRITYDSILTRKSIIFGGGIRRGLDDAYGEAKARYGIITSLPFSERERRLGDADRLRSYLRSQRSRDEHWQEIEEIVRRNPALLTLYHQEMGKIHARGCGKRLREIGVTNAWFAVLEGMTIASGATREEVERILESILPADRRKFAYIFELKQKRSSP